MKRIIISMLLLALLCSTIFCGCTEDKEVATKDEATVTTTETSAITEATTSKVVTNTSATESTVSTTEATTAAPITTEAVVNVQAEADNGNYVSESNNSSSDNQNNSSSVNNNTNNESDNFDNNGKVTKIVFDTDYVTLEVGETLAVSYSIDGKPSELHCVLGQPNLFSAKVASYDTVNVTAKRAGDGTFTLRTEDGVTATCRVHVNYPSVDDITYDTILSYDQINTEKVTQIICDELNGYFPTLGMTYDSTLNKDNSGWFFGHHCSAFGTKDKSINELIESIKEKIMINVDAVCVDRYGATYDIINFNVTYFIEGDSYVIIFCYK